MKKDIAAIKSELDSLVRNGMLNPRDVIDYARNPHTFLHSCFEWNDTKASENYRLYQARKMIRIHVTVIEQPKCDPITTTAYVSLTTDRVHGGYRQIATVLSNKKMRAQLLKDALNEMEYFTRKYQALTELASIFEAFSKLREKYIKA